MNPGSDTQPKPGLGGRPPFRPMNKLTFRLCGLGVFILFVATQGFGGSQIPAVILAISIPIGLGLFIRNQRKKTKEAQLVENATPVELRYRRIDGQLQTFLYGNPNVRPATTLMNLSGEHGTAKLGDGSALPSSGFDDDEGDDTMTPAEAEMQSIVGRIVAKGWGWRMTPDGIELTKPAPDGGSVVLSSLEKLRAIAILIEQGRV